MSDYIDDELSRIAREIDSIRIRKGKSKQTVAAKSGVSRNTIINMMSGRLSYRADNLIAVLDALGLRIEIVEK